MRPERITNSPFHRIGDSYSRFFNHDHFMGRSAFDDSWMAPPKANVAEKGRGYDLQLLMPGVKREDVSVEIENDVLIIDVVNSRESDKPQEPGKKYLQQEIPVKFKKRQFQLPKDVDQGLISAKLKDGILKVKLPYKENAIHISHHVKVA